MRNLKNFTTKTSRIAVWICVDILAVDKYSTEAKIQITLLIVRPLHWCKAWHLWIGIFNGYLNDYLGRIWFQSNAEKIFLLACAQNSHHAHCRFWPILAHMCFGFRDGVFSPVLAFSWNLMGLIGDHLSQNLWPITPKFGRKCDRGVGCPKTCFAEWFSTGRLDLWAK